MVIGFTLAATAVFFCVGFFLCGVLAVACMLLAGVAGGMVKVQLDMFPKNCWQL